MATLLLVGCGKMGSALLSRWRQARAAGIEDYTIIDPAATGDNIFPDLDSVPKTVSPDVVVLAVKPQQMADILPAYAKRFGEKPLYLSIAAGKSVAGLKKILGEKANIVRAMPNTPALIGEGMTALCAAASVSAAQKEIATQLMEAAGAAVWVEDETLMDAVTAISGSGPAYLFLFMEALQHAAMQCGLSEALAETLVRQTVKGSALLAGKEDFAALRKQVTSPGGTTEAAVKMLQGKGFEKLICDAAVAAMQRAHELNK